MSWYKKKYYCYWNLHKKCYSVKYGGRVIYHTRELLLDRVEFKVSEAGRQRVLKEKKKNVHAFVVAQEILEIDMVRSYTKERKLTEFLPKLSQVKYNPYKNEDFVVVGPDGETLSRIYRSEKAALTIEDGKPVIMAVW
jgi:hypothetical protein